MGEIKQGDIVSIVGSGAFARVIEVSEIQGFEFADIHVSGLEGGDMVLGIPVTSLVKIASSTNVYVKPKKPEYVEVSAIASGDVVQLKSGGPLMTVAISPIKDSELKDCVRAIWFDENTGEYTSDDLPSFALVKIGSQA